MVPALIVISASPLSVSSGAIPLLYSIIRCTDVVYQNVINGMKSHNVSVVLQHDIKNFSVNAVERIIQWGLANGYTFLPLTPSTEDVHHGVNN